jgi:hypothetical protein
MSKEWIRGYGQQYRHLVVRTEITKQYKKTHFACGKHTDVPLDPLADFTQPPKCPTCLMIERNTR